jgi:hypothetical protein
MDCDMIPIYTEEEFNNFQHYVKNIMPVNSLSTNRAYYTWNTENYLLLLDKYNKILNKNIEVSYPIEGCDGLFKLYKFENSNKIKEFFEVWNYVLLDSFKTNNDLISGTWNIMIEEILGIVYKLVSIKVNGGDLHYNSVNGIRSFNFPEDRYWDDWTHQNFDTLVNSKEEFIEKNYEKLKNYYNNQGLRFIY